MPTETMTYQTRTDALEEYIQQNFGMTQREFTLDYLIRGERRASVSKRTGIPAATLRNWEQRYAVKVYFDRSQFSETAVTAR